MTAQAAGPGAEFAGQRVVVAGLGVSGPPAARVLADHGARVTAVDSRDDAERRELAGRAAPLGIAVLLGADTSCRAAPTWWSPRPAGGRTRRCWPPRPRRVSR